MVITATLTKVYLFYQNEYNKKIKNISSKNSVNRSKKANKEFNSIWKWYQNTNIRELRQLAGFKTAGDFAKAISICPSCISDLETKKFSRVNKTIIGAYNYFNNNKKEEVNDDDITKHHNELPIKEEVNATDTKELELKIEYLEKLNMKYEKIIDKLIERL